MRNTLVTRRQIARLLVATSFLFCTPAMFAQLIIARNGPCSETILDVELPASGVEQAVKLEITRRSTRATTSATAIADGDRYHTAPLLLPFADDYDITIMSATVPSRRLGKYSLGTSELARLTIPGPDKRPLHVRGDHVIEEHAGVKSELPVDINPARDISTIHIVVLDENDFLVSQYLGRPVQHWRSDPLPPGRYDVWVMQYRPAGCSWVRR